MQPAAAPHRRRNPIPLSGPPFAETGRCLLSNGLGRADIMGWADLDDRQGHRHEIRRSHRTGNFIGQWFARDRTPRWIATGTVESSLRV
ncbi:hypothetical protein AB664_10405 [Brucella anthropi]|uniref:Uncharacterized protein n=1 Tax=Brucella anthropi TaxID=529 RepID=A0A656Z7H0_BRUAN|nr:hypothetical protein AB664_10405 [Brucella anthropi]